MYHSFSSLLPAKFSVFIRCPKSAQHQKNITGLSHRYWPSDLDIENPALFGSHALSLSTFQPKVLSQYFGQNCSEPDTETKTRTHYPTAYDDRETCSFSVKVRKSVNVIIIINITVLLPRNVDLMGQPAPTRSLMITL